MRKGVLVFFLALAVVVAAVPYARAQTGGTPVVVLDGRGFGHGVGLAQWGAKYLADAGATHDDILAKFYPGTTPASAQGTVRVAVYTSTDNRATLSFPSGGEIRSAPDGDQAPGFPVQVGPGGSVLVTYDGQYHATPLVTAQSIGQPVIRDGRVSGSQAGCGLPLQPPCPPPPTTSPPTTTTTEPPPTSATTTTTTRPPGGGGCTSPCPSTTSTTAPPPPSTSPPGGAPGGGTPPADPGTPGGSGGGPSGPSMSTSGGPLWAMSNGVTGVAERGRHYRGLLEATASAGTLRLVNQLDVETYLDGMGEVPATWPLEALATQAVVARTYALRAMTFNGELCDYDLCQVYIGADRETQSQTTAVDATRGHVLTYHGTLASTVYSADAGGITATTLEGFGTPDGTYPYLQVVHYDTPDPQPWRAEIALTDVAARFGYQGTITDVKIGQTGPSGRALHITLDGTAGPQDIDGRSFAAHLGLRSTLFHPTITTDDHVPPPPPAGGTATQALPEDTATITHAALTGDPTTLHPNLTALRNWGRKLATSLSRSTPHTTTLTANPLTWIIITLTLTATLYNRYPPTRPKHRPDAH